MRVKYYIKKKLLKSKEIPLMNLMPQKSHLFDGFYFNFRNMKSIVLVATLICFSKIYSQNSQEFTFKFNVKKWQKSYQKLHKYESNDVVTINLFDAFGNSVQFKVMEKSISEQPMENIKILKGTSEDDKKIISLTILKKSMSGSYLENGMQYFIEPLKNKCNTYKVYRQATKAINLENKELKDFNK